MNISARFKVSLVSSKPTLLGALCILCLPFFSRAQQNKLAVSPADPITVKRGGNCHRDA